MRLVAGTRGSKLALIQTDEVIRNLMQMIESIEVFRLIIKTSGDKMDGQSISSINDVGAFEKEINNAVDNDEVDFAVHSMKDLPIDYNANLMIAAVSDRESPYDALVSNSGYNITEIPSGAIVGIGSPRREAQLRYLRPDLNIKPISGNIDTRIRKLEEGFFDAIILAEAGLNRLNIKNKTKRLPPKDFPAAPGQGAIAITIKRDREDLRKIFKQINNSKSNAEITAERTFLSQIGSGCKVPIGALAVSKRDNLSMYAMLFSSDGKHRVQSTFHGRINNPEEVGKKAAKELIKESEKVANMVKHIE
ncbi:MAG: hydroxymethylbilane synthase [Nitrososphaerales archaeon]|nr:hydroxymethylbilane synthase [Nitrososphaerales archaeon]HJN58492.1 hydroxymethylbilane synthase [Nitrososphaerales archaeon]